MCLNSGSASFGGHIWRPVMSLSWRLSQSEGSSKCSTLPCFWRMHGYYPSWFHISKDSLRSRKSRKQENDDIAWRRSSLTRSPGSRNCDVRVKHLVTQPGNAPKARPSHLTTADAVKKVSEGLAFEDCKGFEGRIQTLNWDTDIVNTAAAAVSDITGGSFIRLHAASSGDTEKALYYFFPHTQQHSSGPGN